MRGDAHNILRALRRWERVLGNTERLSITRHDIRAFLERTGCVSEASGRKYPRSKLRVVRRRLDRPVDLDTNAVVLSSREAARHIRGNDTISPGVLA